MATHPKLEFYRFNLKHKKKEHPTFKDFVTDELGGRAGHSNETLYKRLFAHFKDQLSGEHAKDDKLKKMLKLEKKNNIHLSKQPKFNSEEFTISGVINGGPYGRDRVLGDTQDDEASERIGKSKVVYLYFYFYAYFPLDHDQGFFMIHSNNAEESITSLFRNFVCKIFAGENYKKGNATVFCPQSFQDEFKKESVIQSLVFEETYLETTFNTKSISESLPGYRIRIEAIPKNGDIPVSEANYLKKFFSSMGFGKKNEEKQLQDFDKTKLKTKKNKKSTSTKIFEWNSRESNFVPVVYLKDFINDFNEDGTPDFDVLDEYCKKIFNDQIVKEVRPDLNAISVN